MNASGKTAYDAYCKSTGGVSLISGDKLPEFEKLKPTIQRAWQDSADAVLLASSMVGISDSPSA